MEKCSYTYRGYQFLSDDRREDEIDRVIFQAAYGDDRYYHCLQNLASIIKAVIIYHFTLSSIFICFSRISY